MKNVMSSKMPQKMGRGGRRKASRTFEVITGRNTSLSDSGMKLIVRKKKTQRKVMTQTSAKRIPMRLRMKENLLRTKEMTK